MKRIIIVLLLTVAFTAANAQTSDENSNFKLEYVGWNSYSSYAGYVVWATNYTGQTQTLQLEIPYFGIVQTYELQPNVTLAFTLNFSEGYQIPYIPKMWIRATLTTDTGISKLKVKTP